MEGAAYIDESCRWLYEGFWCKTNLFLFLKTTIVFLTIFTVLCTVCRFTECMKILLDLLLITCNSICHVLELGFHFQWDELGYVLSLNTVIT